MILKEAFGLILIKGTIRRSFHLESKHLIFHIQFVYL